MPKSFKDRLAALEQLERAAHAPPERVLCLFLYIRLTEYAALLGDDDDAAQGVAAAYGLDQIADGERVNVWGGTWPMALPWNELTISGGATGDGYGWRIDVWPVYANAPAPGEWRWVVAGGDTAVLQLARDGLIPLEGATPELSFAPAGVLHATSSGDLAAQVWEPIADRAGALLATTGQVIVPLSVEDIRASLSAFDAGIFTARALYPHCWRSHHTTVCCPYNNGRVTDMQRLRMRLASALDQWSYQTGGVILETVEAVCAVLARLEGGCCNAQSV